MTTVRGDDRLARPTLTRRSVLIGAAATAVFAGRGKARAQSAAATPEGSWSFTDDRGITIAMPERPDRIVAQTTSAAALWDLGVRPVGIFGPSRLADGSPDYQAGNIDLDAVDVLGDYPEIDLEKLVALQADLYVDLTIKDNAFWYLGPDVEARVDAIVPTLGISMARVSILDSISRFEELARSLGADLDAPDVVEAKAAFARAEADLKSAIAEKPGLKVLVIAPTPDQLYIASPDWMTDLHYFRDLGLDVVTHTTDDFFELISWEQIGNYPADLILTDARTDQLQLDQLAEIETWKSLPAVQAGQVGSWYAGAPYSHKRLTPIVEELTEIVRGAQPDIV